MRRLVVAAGCWFALASLAGCERAPQPGVAADKPAAVAPVVSVTAATSAASGPTATPSLKFVEVVKGGAATDALPMVVALHGLGDNAADFARLFDGFEGPGRVIVMQAPTRYGDGWSWFATRKDATSVSVHAQGIVDAAERVAADTALLAKTRPTKGKPVVTGFSQGGMLSFTLALRHPEMFERAVPLAGWLPEALWPSTRSPTMIPIVALHGDADTMLPVGPTRDGVAHLKKLGYDVELRVFPGVTHSVSREMRRELFGFLQR